jgi:hypothetical protein
MRVAANLPSVRDIEPTSVPREADVPLVIVAVSVDAVAIEAEIVIDSVPAAPRRSVGTPLVSFRVNPRSALVVPAVVNAVEEAVKEVGAPPIVIDAVINASPPSIVPLPVIASFPNCAVESLQIRIE